MPKFQSKAADVLVNWGIRGDNVQAAMCGQPHKEKTAIKAAIATVQCLLTTTVGEYGHSFDPNDKDLLALVAVDIAPAKLAEIVSSKLTFATPDDEPYTAVDALAAVESALGERIRTGLMRQIVKTESIWLTNLIWTVWLKLPEQARKSIYRNNLFAIFESEELTQNIQSFVLLDGRGHAKCQICINPNFAKRCSLEKMAGFIASEFAHIALGHLSKHWRWEQGTFTTATDELLTRWGFDCDGTGHELFAGLIDSRQKAQVTRLSSV